MAQSQVRGEMLTAIHKITINSQSDEADLGLAGQVSWCPYKHSYDNERRTSIALLTSPPLLEQLWIVLQTVESTEKLDVQCPCPSTALSNVHVKQPFRNEPSYITCSLQTYQLSNKSNFEVWFIMSVNNVILKAQIFNDIICTLQWFDLNHFRSLIMPQSPYLNSPSSLACLLKYQQSLIMMISW